MSNYIYCLLANRKIMDIKITKEQLEQQLGYRIQDFDLRPLYDGEICIGLSVRVVPVESIEEIAITGIIKNDLEYFYVC